VFNGVAVDSHRAIVYLAKYANDTFSLYELGLQEDGHAHLKDILDWSMPPFGNSVDRDIGPMAVDASQSVLFAADRLAGDLYRVNLLDLNDHRKLHLRDSHGHTRDSLGSPSALAIDSTGRTLYVADNKRLWVVRLNTDPAQVEGPWQPYQFHQLSAVAVDNNNNVWVGDQGEHTIHVLSSAGILMRTFRY